MRWLDGIDSMEMSMSKFRETVKDREAWHAAVHGVTKNQKQLSDSTTAKQELYILKIYIQSIKKKSTYSFCHILSWSWTAQISVKQPPTMV